MGILWILPHCGGSAESMVIAIGNIKLFWWLTAIVLFEVAFVTPLLTDRAKYIILNTIDDGDNAQQKAVITRLGAEVNWKGKQSFNDAPSIKWHFVYVALELIKVCLLGLLGYGLSNYQ